MAFLTAMLNNSPRRCPAVPAFCALQPIPNRQAPV